MKKSLLLIVVLVAAMAAFGLSSYAADPSAEMSLLQQKASRVETQIQQAQQQCGNALQDQVRPLKATIENLVREKVRIDSHIAQLESQVETINQSQASSCGRQVNQYRTELEAIKQQISSLAAKKPGEPTLPSPGK
jgi:peptidoglycan hydrolase CwlO-like protein